jgi:hypothetical protein
VSSDKERDPRSDDWIIWVVVAFVSILTLPVVILMFALYRLARRQQTAMIGAALAGGALFYVLSWPAFQTHWKTSRTQIMNVRKSQGLEKAAATAAVSIPRFWLLTLPLAPLAALGYDFFRPRSAEEKLVEEEERRENRAHHAEQDAWKRAQKVQAKPSAHAGPEVGTIKRMKYPLPDFTQRGQRLYLNTQSSAANLHSLLFGGSGSGKTTTMLRLVASFAEHTDYDLFLIDPKNDKKVKQEFAGLVGQQGRRCRMYPDEPFDGFKGDARALHNRFLTIPVLGTEGASAYYTEMTEDYLWLAINAGDTLPQSFAEVEQRLEYSYLEAFYAHDPANLQRLKRIQARDAHSIAMRFGNIARKLDGLAAGGWSFEGSRAGYFGLPVLAASRDVSALAKYLIEDLKHYFAERKSRSRRTVLFIDEFSALGSENVVNLMELVRSLGGIVVLASQTIEALGDESLQRRILGNVTIYLHRMNDPRQVAELGGMQQRMAVTHRYDAKAGQPLNEGQIRYEDEAIIDPTKAMRLAIGAAYIINQGRVAEVLITRPPVIDWEQVDFGVKAMIAGIRKAPDRPLVPTPPITPPPLAEAELGFSRPATDGGIAADDSFV